MLKERIITSIVLLLIITVGLFVLPENGFVILMLIMLLIATQEVLKMYKFNIYFQIVSLSIFLLILLAIYFIKNDISIVICILGIISWGLIVPIVLYKQPKYFSKLIIYILCIIIFIPAFYSFVIIYKLMGAMQLISIMAVAWISDIGAYFIGRKFGKHKIAPTISPGKSLEGALAGLVLVLLYFTFLKYFNLVSYLNNYISVIRFALILTTIGILGDLFESWLKRIAGVKDSGTILPGHGGVLDRIDSLIAVITIAFVMIRGLI